MDDVMASEIVLFETVYFSTYSRPKYDNIESAIEDLKECIHYCKHYDMEVDTLYPYKYAVNEEGSETFTILMLRKENARLLNENMKFYNENARLRNDNIVLRCAVNSSKM